jgi:phospholipase C
MMQENRSFDHYFGTLRGVRGYGDNRTTNLSNGSSVWYQPNGGGYLLPFHPGAPNLGLQFIEALKISIGQRRLHRNENQPADEILKKGGQLDRNLA